MSEFCIGDTHGGADVSRIELQSKHEVVVHYYLRYGEFQVWIRGIPHGQLWPDKGNSTQAAMAR